MIIVITVPSDPDSMADAFLPPTPRAFTRGLWSFRFYQVDDDGEIGDQELFDPIDGALLIAYHSFPTEAAAYAWVCGRSETVR